MSPTSHDPRDPIARIERLVDDGKFEFLVPRTECGMLAVTGSVKGCKVVIFASDATIKSGALGIDGSKVIVTAYKAAMGAQLPIIGIWHSGGARLSDGVASLDAFGEVFQSMISASGRIPQLSLVLGPTAGGGAYGPALTDVVVLAPEGRIFVTGPDVVKTVLGEEISFEELGGANTHGSKSGVAHFVAENEYECMDYIKKLISFLPQNNTEQPPKLSTDDDPNRLDHNLINIMPENPLQPYDMKEIINSIVDNHEFFEVHELFAPNIVIGYGRLNGNVVGIVANQPMHLAGALDIDSSNKASRFIRFCDSFNVPIITLVDTPGYMPGSNQEHNGIIRHGSKLLYAYCEATVPRITLVIGKAYGGAYIAMGSKNLRTDVNYAWPTAKCAVLGGEAAVKIMNRKELAASDDPESLKKELIDEFAEKFENPYVAASHGTVDNVINPAETRPMLIKALEMLANKREKQLPRKHGNINL